MSRRRSVTALNVEDVLQNSPSRQPPRHSISKYRTEGHHAVCPDPFAVATSHSRRKVTWPENQRLAAPEGEDARLKAILSDYEECSQKWRTVPVTNQKASETVSRSRGTQNYVRLHNNIEKMQSEIQIFYEEQLRRAIEANPHVIARLRHAQHAGTMPDPDDAALCDEQQAHLDEVITSIYQLRQSSMRFMSMFLNDEEKRHLGGRLHYMFGDDAEDEKIPAHRRYVPQRVLDATLNQREMEAIEAAAAAERNNRAAEAAAIMRGGGRGESTSLARTASQAQSQNSSHFATNRRSSRGALSEEEEEAAAGDAEAAEAHRRKDKRDKKDKKERRREEAGRRAAGEEDTEETQHASQQQHLVSTPVDQGLQVNGGGAVGKRSSLKSAASGNGNGGMREKDVARIPSSIAVQQQHRLRTTSPSRCSAISTNGGDADVAEFASIDDVPLPWAVSVRHDSSASPSRASSRESSPRKRPHTKSPGKQKNHRIEGANNNDIRRSKLGSGQEGSKSGNTSRKGSHSVSTHADPNILSSSDNVQSALTSGTQQQAVSTTDMTTSTTTAPSKDASKRGGLNGTLQKDHNLHDAGTGDASIDVADASSETHRKHEHDQQDLYEEVHSGQLCLSPISRHQKEQEDAAADAERMRAMIQEELEKDRQARAEAERERIQFIADEAAVLAQVAAEEAEMRIKEESAKRAALEEQLRQVEAERDAARAASIDPSSTRNVEGAAETSSVSSIHSDDSDFTKELKTRNQRKRGVDQKGKKEVQPSTCPDPLNATTALSINCTDGVERIDVGPKPVRLSRLKLQEGEFHRHGCKPIYKLGMAAVDGTHHHKREYHHSASAQPSPRRALTPRQHTILGIDLPLQFTTRARSIPPPKYISPAVTPKKLKSDEKATDKKKSVKTADNKRQPAESKNTPPVKGTATVAAANQGNDVASSAAVSQRTSSGTRRRVRADSSKKKAVGKEGGGGSAGAPA